MISLFFFFKDPLLLNDIRWFASYKVHQKHMMALSQIKQTVRSTTASYVQKLQAVELLYRLGHTKH